MIFAIFAGWFLAGLSGGCAWCAAHDGFVNASPALMAIYAGFSAAMALTCIVIAGVALAIKETK